MFTSGKKFTPWRSFTMALFYFLTIREVHSFSRTSSGRGRTLSALTDNLQIGYAMTKTADSNARISALKLSRSSIASENSFVEPSRFSRITNHNTYTFQKGVSRGRMRSAATSLNMVWWFTGSSGTEVSTTTDGDSCELVAVRIDAPSPNSRRIMGEITVDGCPVKDVWAVLTDYDRLAIHVPNLVESKRIPGSLVSSKGEQGDGTYKCRLYQRGAQKIIGFEFGASVTMDMTEEIICLGPTNRMGSNGTMTVLERNGLHSSNLFPPERRIKFKCVESPFFNEFDGEWRVREEIVDGQVSSIVKYTVDVKPRGPVPVAALEWRIREDVPTNLRAIKKASQEVGYEGVMAARNGGRINSSNNGVSNYASANRVMDTRRGSSTNPGQDKLVESIQKSFKRTPYVNAVDWGEDETMAAYLRE